MTREMLEWVIEGGKKLGQRKGNLPRINLSTIFLSYYDM